MILRDEIWLLWCMYSSDVYAYPSGETTTSEQVYRLVKKFNSIAFVIELPTSYVLSLYYSSCFQSYW